MWVPATDSGVPSTVTSTTSAARRTRSARRALMGTTRVASMGSSGRTSTAIPNAPCSASCQRARARTCAGRGRTPSMYSALFCSVHTSRALHVSGAPAWGLMRRPSPRVCATT